MFFGKKKPQTDQKDIGSKYLAVLEISNLVSMSLKVEDVLEKSVGLIVRALNYASAVIFINDKEGRKVRSKTFTNKAINFVATSLIKDSFASLYVDYSEGDNLIVKTVLENKIYQGDNLSKFITPVVSQNLAGVLQFIGRAGYITSVPIVYKNEVLGAIMFTRTQAEPFDPDINVLKVYAQQIGIAMYNAKSFKEKQQQVDLLAQQNHDLQSLYTLTSNVGKSLDPKTVLQTAVDSLPQDDVMIGAVINTFTDSTKTRVGPTAVSENQISAGVRRLVGDFNKYSVELNNAEVQNSPLVMAIKTGQPIYSNDVIPWFSPPVPKGLAGSVSKLLNVKSLAIIPLSIRGNLIGAISYMLRDKTAEEIDDNRKRLFQTYTIQIGIALENANLYTASMEIQQNLQKALAELQESRRRERDMIDIMGHELRTPMSIVKNSLAMLDKSIRETGNIPPENLKKYVSIGLESARRESNLIETLLSATKADSKGFELTLEKVDMKDVVEDSFAGFQAESTKKGLQLKFNYMNNENFAYADRTRVQEISDNLIGNAIKYTEKGYVEVSITQDEQYIWVHIIDTGVGISQEDVAKLGKKFFRAKQHMGQEGQLEVIRPGGTGLGLYVAFSLIKLQEGTYKVVSTPGQGSTFSFGLPKYANQPKVQVQRNLVDAANT